jgi:hypothetical protein
MDRTDLQILAPDSVTLSRDHGELTLIVGDHSAHVGVTLVRAFPLSDPNRYWGLLDTDGKEIGVIADPSALDPESREVALEEMEKRYFIPIVQRVVRTKEDYGSIVWEVETDRGERTFTVRNMKDSIVELGASRILLVDVDGNRFEFPDIHRLDAKSYDLILRSQ